MKTTQIKTIALAMLAVAVSATACKSKKELPKPPEQAEVPVKAVLPVKETKPAFTDETAGTSVTTATGPVVEKVDYSKFVNLQFEFNSAILKTSSYPMLDKVARAMKSDASLKFKLKGYASAEGTPAHNMELSEQRANAVKTYLLNGGVADSQLSVKGYGEANPIKPNTTEENKALNRRVEIRL